MKKIILITVAIASIIFACTKTDPKLVKIKGTVTNPIGEVVSIDNEDVAFGTNIDGNGNFEMSFVLDSAVYFNFHQGSEVTAMYIKPGDRINLTIDTEQFDESITYEGSAESTYLAHKYLLEEDADLYGEDYYLSSPEEYKAKLDKFKNTLVYELESINDSLFVNNEIKTIDRLIDYYIKRQGKLSDYSIDVRRYMMESGKVARKYDFYYAVDTMNITEFDELLNDYIVTLNELLSQVEDEEYATLAKESIVKTTDNWRERKLAVENMPKEGEPAVDFTYTDKDGNEFPLSSFKGTLVYVDIWATWCGPCIAETPDLQKLEEEYHGKKITFLSVSVDNDKEAWLKYLNDNKLGGVQLWADGWSSITKDYAIFGIPRFMLFSSKGTVISTNAPRPSSDKIRGLLDANL